MSNFYKSKCCGEQVEIIAIQRNMFTCLKCGKLCEVEAVIDKTRAEAIEEIKVQLKKCCS